MLGCCRLPENFNTRPSPVWNMHFEGTQNMYQMRSPFMEKGEYVLTRVYFGSKECIKELKLECASLFTLSSKGVKHYSIILIILIIIIAPRQLGIHHMQLDLHSLAFKNSNLSIDTA